MNVYLRRIKRYLLTRSDAGRKWLAWTDLRRHLDHIGWFRSVEEQLPVDRDGNCLPWFTYPMISFLNERVQSDMTVFEYGSGNSTLWWSKRVSGVVSYEHDFEWYSSLTKRVPSNVEYRHLDLEHGGEYCKAVLGYKKRFDIIVIDGRDRVNCARNSLGALRDNGVMIWDDSGRKRYQNGYSYLLKNGFRRLDFEGLGPIASTRKCTSIFYRDNNCFGI